MGFGGLAVWGDSGREVAGLRGTGVLLGGLLKGVLPLGVEIGLLSGPDGARRSTPAPPQKRRRRRGRPCRRAWRSAAKAPGSLWPAWRNRTVLMQSGKTQAPRGAPTRQRVWPEQGLLVMHRPRHALVQEEGGQVAQLWRRAAGLGLGCFCLVCSAALRRVLRQDRGTGPVACPPGAHSDAHRHHANPPQV